MLKNLSKQLKLRPVSNLPGYLIGVMKSLKLMGKKAMEKKKKAAERRAAANAAKAAKDMNHPAFRSHLRQDLGVARGGRGLSSSPHAPQLQSSYPNAPRHGGHGDSMGGMGPPAADFMQSGHHGQGGRGGHHGQMYDPMYDQYARSMGRMGREGGKGGRGGYYPSNGDYGYGQYGLYGPPPGSGGHGFNGHYSQHGYVSLWVCVCLFCEGFLDRPETTDRMNTCSTESKSMTTNNNNKLSHWNHTGNITPLTGSFLISGSRTD